MSVWGERTENLGRKVRVSLLSVLLLFFFSFFFFFQWCVELLSLPVVLHNSPKHICGCSFIWVLFTVCKCNQLRKTTVVVGIFSLYLGITKKLFYLSTVRCRSYLRNSVTCHLTARKIGKSNVAVAVQQTLNSLLKALKRKTKCHILCIVSLQTNLSCYHVCEILSLILLDFDFRFDSSQLHMDIFQANSCLFFTLSNSEVILT